MEVESCAGFEYSYNSPSDCKQLMSIWTLESGPIYKSLDTPIANRTVISRAQLKGSKRLLWIQKTLRTERPVWCQRVSYYERTSLKHKNKLKAFFAMKPKQVVGLSFFKDYSNSSGEQSMHTKENYLAHSSLFLGGPWSSKTVYFKTTGSRLFIGHMLVQPL